MRRDTFLHSKAPLWIRQPLHIRRATGPKCEEHSFVLYLHGHRTASCFDPTEPADSPERDWKPVWFTDVQAHTCVLSRPVQQAPICPAELDTAPATAGNPVQLSTGNKIELELDFSDFRAASLDFVRIYNSGWIDEHIPHPPSSFGQGWTHNHAAWLRSARQEMVIDLHTNAGPHFIEPNHERFTVYLGLGERAVFHRTLSDEQYANIPEDAIGHTAPGPFEGGLPGQSFERTIGGWRFVNEHGHEWLFNDQGQVTSQRRPNGDHYHYSYEAGLLTRIANQFGRSIELQYARAGEQFVIQRIAPSHGRAVRYFAPSGLLEQVQFADGSAVRYHYENPNAPFLTGKTDETGARIGTYRYEGERVIQSQKAPQIEHFAYSYQHTSGNHSTTVRTPLQEDVRFHFPKYNLRSATVTSHRSKISSLQDEPIQTTVYSPDLLPTLRRDYQGSATALTWDKVLRLPTQITQAQGSAQLERNSLIEWHPHLRVPTRIVQPESGQSWELDYDARGNPTALRINGAGGASAWAWSWSAQDELLSQTQPDGSVTRHTYDQRQRRTSTTDALGRTTRYSRYDDWDRLLEATDAAGRHYQLSWDGRDRLTRIAIDGLATDYHWRPNGTLSAVHYPNGYRINFQYDNAQRMTGWSDNRGHNGSYRLDAVGNALEETIHDAQGQLIWQLHRTITDNNRIASISQAGQTLRYGYDNNGELNRITNSLGQSTFLRRDLLGRIDHIHDPLGHAVALVYNPLDDLLQATDAKGVATHYERDHLGNPTRETSPDSGQRSAQYNLQGLPVRLSDALGQTTHIERDALGRPTHLRYADGQHSAIAYHPSGAIAQLDDPGVQTRIERDQLGRPIRQEQTIAASATHGPASLRASQYHYVPAGQGGAGQIAGITYPSGKTLHYQHDASGQITAVQWNGQNLLSALRYNPLGQPTAWQWDFIAPASQRQALRQYNSAGQLVQTELAQYHWDSAARLERIEQDILAPASGAPAGSAAASASIQTQRLQTRFRYDAAGRLSGYEHSPIQFTHPLPEGISSWHLLGYHQAQYQYDRNGNRTQATYQWPRQNHASPGNNHLHRQFSLDASHNRIQDLRQRQSIEGRNSHSTQRFIWDEAGQLLDNGRTQHQHDARGHVASTSWQGQRSHHLYNSASQRVRKNSPQGHSDYHYGPAELELNHWPLGIYHTGAGASANANTSASIEILYLPTASGPLPVAADIDGQLYAIHSDHLHTPRRLSNAQGEGVWQWIISGFGEMPATHAGNSFVPEGQATAPALGPAIDFPLRYPGQIEDNETGLFYNHHRYYDPYLSVGYTQADPIGLAGGWNRFIYADANPIGGLDWDGLQVRGNVPRPTRGGAIVTPGQQILNLQGQALIRQIQIYEPRFRYTYISSPGSGFTYAEVRSLQQTLGRLHERPICPRLPTTLVGDQSDPRAGPRKRRHTSGRLLPEFGGTGDFHRDLQYLTGGTRVSTGDKYPPGVLVGRNGIIGRPYNKSGGSSIDIPANNDKPHETLHY